MNEHKQTILRLELNHEDSLMLHFILGHMELSTTGRMDALIDYLIRETSDFNGEL